MTLLRDVLVTPSALTTVEGRAGMLVRIGQLEVLARAAREDCAPDQGEDDSDDVKACRQARASEVAELQALAAVVRFHGVTDASSLAALVEPLAAVCHEGGAVEMQKDLTTSVFSTLSCDTLRQLRQALPSPAWRKRSPSTRSMNRSLATMRASSSRSRARRAPP